MDEGMLSNKQGNGIDSGAIIWEQNVCFFLIITIFGNKFNQPTNCRG